MVCFTQKYLKAHIINIVCLNCLLILGIQSVHGLWDRILSTEEGFKFGK